MDAFDNPARNGMDGLQRDGASIDQSNGAAAGSDLLAATAQVTAAVSATPLAIQAILVPDASGRIALPAGISIDDITVSGTDLIVTLPNGQVLIIPNGAVDVPAIVIDGDTVPASTVAQLLEGLTDFNPEAGLRSSGGNFADPEGPIQDAYALGDLLPYTELAFPQPEDRELIPEVPDEEPTVVIVTPDQPAGATAATASVDEAGLPERGEEPAGSNSAATSETTTGSIVYDAADGLDSITINGTAITAVGQVITTPLGQLTITSLNPGSVGYSYTLADNTDAGANLTDLFTVVITDRDGDTATATLTIDIIDDVPTARNDTDQLAPGSFAPETGHVITGAGTTSGSTGADTEGADGASLTGVTAGAGATFSAPGTAISGQYGMLTLNADGSYSYVRNPNTPGGVSDVFTYQLVDGDGDTSTATLTIAIGDSPNTIDFVPGPGDNTTVNESHLPPRDGESEGSAFDGDAETTTGTITFTSPDGVASVAIEGVIITPDALPQTVFSDETGTLVITAYNYDPVTGEGSITYDYTLADNALNPGDTSVSFDIVVTDLDGDSASDTLDITIIDDMPTARDDADSVTEDGPLTADGNVLTGSGGGDANTTDGVADTQGADGANVTSVNFGATAGSVGAPLAGAYGTLTLNSDGSYSYILSNAAQPVQGLSAGETLTEVFTYSITDGDGDPATATLTITINGADDGVTITGLDAEGAELTVDEDDLADGSSPDAAALTQSGTFDISTPDGLGNVTIGGAQVVTNGVFTPGTATSPLGTVNITGFAPVTGADGSVIGGTFTYEYVLDDNTLTHPAEGQDSVTDSFAVVVTDSDGSSANASLDVAITDDVPTARDDADSVTEDGPLTADGNVLTGGGGGDANMTDGVADTQGADGATVTAVEGGTVGASFATTYGMLTLNSDGSYTYVLNNAAQPVQGLSAGETLTESFEYEITDGDGDPATATLTITINGADDGVTINGLDAQGAELFVDEDDLPARTGEAPGSDTSPEGVTDGDSFSVSTPDGMGSVVLDSFNGVPLGAPLTLVTADGSFTPQSVVTAYGTLNITGFTPVTGADGSVIGGTFTYSYTLADNRTDHPAMGEDDRTDSIGVTVTDIDGSSASDSIDIRITDDVPDAIDDAATQTLENAQVTVNVLANDVQGADSVQPSAVELVDGSLTGAGSLVYNGDGSFTYTPAAQETGTVSFQYQIIDGDGDTDIATATITLVADSIPQIRNADDVTVDEDGLLGANIDNGLPGEVTSTGSASAAGTITIDFGSDIPVALAGSLVLDDSAALDTQLTVGGVPVTFAKDGDDLVGSVGGDEVIRISLTTATAGPGATEVTYGYSVTLSQAIDQALAGSEDSDLLAGIGFTVTDSDNSTASGSFDITIVDDLPTLVVSDTPVSAVEGGPAVEGTWSLDPGADGVTSILVTFGSESDTLTLPAGASVVLVQPTGTLTVNADGSFSFVATGNQNQNLAPSATFTLSAVDGDDDPTSDSLTITIDDGANPTGGDTLALTVNEAAIDGIGRTPASDAETDSGTLSFTAGSDTLGDFAFVGVDGLVTTLDGVGIDIFWSLSPDGQTITGSLTDGGPAAITISLTAPASIAPGATDTATVTVTLADNLPHELEMAAQTQSLGSVTVTASDTDGDVATGTVTIDVIDDIPTATAEPLASLDEGTTVSGAFDFVEGADGSSLTQINGNDVSFNPDGWSDWLDLGAGDLRVRADGSYEFRADAVTLSPVAPITGTFTVTDGDADTATAGFSFQIDDANAPTGGSASAAVDDDGLTGPPAGNPASIVGDLDANLNDDPGDTSEASFTGTLGGSVGDDGAGANGFAFGTNTTAVVGLETVSFALVGDVLTATVTASPDAGRIGIDLFTVEITDPSTGAYTVTLLDNVLHAGGPNAEATDATVAIDYSITDADGSTVPGNILTITFDDDAPTARPDTDSIAEGDIAPATGNVIIGADAGSADATGADGAAVTGVVAGTSPTAVTGNVGSTLDGSYGSLTLNADGEYSYTLDNSDPAVQALGANETLTETFTYTITDGDGDTATTTLTITINGTNDAPTIGSATTAVSDEGLAGGLPDTDGLPDTTDLAVRTGTISVGDVDGDALTVSIGVPATSLESGGQPIVWDNSDPHLLLGKVGTTTIISVAIEDDGDFTVSLLGPIDHPDTTIEDALELIVPVSVSDGIATVVNPTALTIGLEDDSPVAVAPVGTSLVNVAGASILGSLDTDGDVDDNFGGDGGKVIFTSATIAALEAQDLTSGLDPLTYSISLDGQVLTAEKSNGDDVFIITLQPAGSPDQYQVEIIRPIDSVQDVSFTGSGFDIVGGNGSWAGFVPALQEDNPVNDDSQDLLLTPIVNGVNTSTVNTNATEAGVGGNFVDNGEGLRLDFVTDLTGTPTTGGAGYSGPGGAAHVFDGHYVVNGASALFTAITGGNGPATVRMDAYEDADGNTTIGDGSPVDITAVAITYNGETLLVSTAGTVMVGGASFTVTFSGTSASVSGVVSDTRLAAFTDDGYNSVSFTSVSGEDFKIGSFGASKIVNEPVPFTVPVAVVDGDGDTSALADIDIVAEPVAPPVVLDLDGDGVEYLSSASGVTFDYAGDGNAVSTAWVDPSDGLLAFDANGNGRVDNGTEIVFGSNGLTDLQGVAARFDSNGDGVLDADDADFASFGVWQDANSNGVADDGEFRTLDQAGIVAIDLVSDGEAYTTANGSVHVFGESSYTLADGTVRTVADAAFARTGSVKSQDRPVAATPLADALVAASLIAMAQGAQAAERAPTRFVANDGALPETVDEGAVRADVAESVAGRAALDLGAEVAPAARAADGATHHADEAVEVAASIADAGYSGWRSDDVTAKDGGSSDALFDAPSATPGAAAAMDGLLMLGLAAAEAVAAQAASVSAPDPAATEVLAEVLDEGNAIDRLIDALAGSAAIEMAHAENPAFDLAQLLEQKVVPDAAFAAPPSADLDLHQMATA